MRAVGECSPTELYPEPQDLPPNYSLTHVRKEQRVLEKHGLPVCCYSVPPFIHCMDGRSSVRYHRAFVFLLLLHTGRGQAYVSLTSTASEKKVGYQVNPPLRGCLRY